MRYRRVWIALLALAGFYARRFLSRGVGQIARVLLPRDEAAGSLVAHSDVIGAGLPHVIVCDFGVIFSAKTAAVRPPPACVLCPRALSPRPSIVANSEMKLAILIAVASCLAANASSFPGGDRKGPGKAPAPDLVLVEAMLAELELGELRDVLSQNGITDTSLMLLDRAMMDKLGINAGMQLRIENYLQGKRPVEAATAVDTAVLPHLVSDIMLSDQMADLLTNIIRHNVRHEVQAALANTTPSSPRRTNERRLPDSGGVVCALSGCGDAGECPSYNKELDGITDCAQCSNHKYSVNTLFKCGCEFTCVAPTAEAPLAEGPAVVASAADTTGAASANVAGATVWLEDDQAEMRFGTAGDVSLFKNPEGKHGLRTAQNFTVDGEIVVQGSGVLASIQQIQRDLATTAKVKQEEILLSQGQPAAGSWGTYAESPPSKAVDGNYGRDHPNQFHSNVVSKREDAWLRITLKHRAKNPRIKIYARSCCTASNYGGTLFFYISDEKVSGTGSLEKCGEITDVTDSSTKEATCVGEGRYFYLGPGAVSSTFGKYTMDIPEVEVFSQAETQHMGSVTTNSLSLFGALLLGQEPGACEESNAGALVWNALKLSVDVCNGFEWGPIYEAPVGTQNNPASSCKEIADKPASSHGDGVYWIKPAGTAVEVFCDMTTNGGGWTYVARGSLSSDGDTTSAYGSVQKDETKIVRWSFGQDLINKIGGNNQGSSAFIEYFVTGGHTQNSPTHSSRPGEWTYFRIFRTDQKLRMDDPMDKSHGVDVWTGSKWEAATYECNPTDAGPCWEPNHQNTCCQRNSAGNWHSCAQAPKNQEGQWSNDNTNQHLRCDRSDSDQDSLVLFVRQFAS